MLWILIISVFSFTSKEDFSTEIRKLAFVEMSTNAAYNKNGEFIIPIDVIVAQAQHEASHGESYSAKVRNNVFGLSCFKKCSDGHCSNNLIHFQSLEECVKFHIKNLATKRYSHLHFTTTKKWVEGLQPAGYCTDLEYGFKLNKLIK